MGLYDIFQKCKNRAHGIKSTYESPATRSLCAQPEYQKLEFVTFFIKKYHATSVIYHNL
jgi:hypothetical protein